ncbi:MAG: hypothetical protein SGI83_00135 [Bacteroidota bacterium]|nr:hypothetical protein [Bacteroidota bacterium]
MYFYSIKIPDASIAGVIFPPYEKVKASHRGERDKWRMPVYKRLKLLQKQEGK